MTPEDMAHDIVSAFPPVYTMSGLEVREKQSQQIADAVRQAVAAEREACVWTYSFCVWPDETRSWGTAMFELFDMMKFRIEKQFTEEQFGRFRGGLLRNGITLREIERWPYHQPEGVL